MKNTLYILLFTVLVSCGGRLENDKVAAVASEAMAPAKMAAFNAADQSATVTIERKLIRNGYLMFETSDVTKTKSSIEAISKELNAYISNESQNNMTDRLQYNQTIRVPADKFDLLIQRIEADAVKVESKDVNTQDVTEEFIDVEARLKTKKELETRYRELLKQAKTVQDIVSIESQISNVRSEIESMEGRLNYLKNQVSFSTLNVSYYQIIGTDFGFATKAFRALGRGWDNLLSFLIFLVNLWPFILIILGVAWGTNRWRKRKKIGTGT